MVTPYLSEHQNGTERGEAKSMPQSRRVGLRLMLNDGCVVFLELNYQKR